MRRTLALNVLCAVRETDLLVPFLLGRRGHSQSNIWHHFGPVVMALRRPQNKSGPASVWGQQGKAVPWPKGEPVEQRSRSVPRL